MARVSIWNLSREDEDVLDNVNATEVTVIDDLEQATNDQDLVANASQVETDIVTMEESEEVIEELQEQVVENEHMIENSPENITEEIVAVAQEKYFIAAARLGYPTEELMKNRISLEAARVSPVQALTISTEGVKETLKKMLEAMKNMFSKIVESIKKLLARAAMFFGGVVSKAQELKKRLDKLGEIKVEKVQMDDIYFKMPIFISACGNEFKPQEIMNFVNINYLREIINIATNTTPPSAQPQTQKGQGLFSKIGNGVKSIVMSVGNFILGIEKAHQQGGIGGKAKFLYDYVKQSQLADENDVFIIVEAYKNYINVIGIDVEHDGIQFTKYDLPQDKLQAPDAVKGLNVANLKKALDLVITNDKTKKQYFDVIYQSQNNLTTLLNKFNNLQDDESAEAQREIRLMRVFGSKLAFSSVMQYINTNKAIVDIVARAIDMTKSVKKDELRNSVNNQQQAQQNQGQQNNVNTGQNQMP